jgi:hypothetical protein
MKDALKSKKYIDQYVNGQKWKPLANGKGEFCRCVPDNIKIGFDNTCDDSGSWKKLIEIVSQTNDLRGCLFHRIIEFSKIGLIRRKLKMKSIGDQTIYTVPMGCQLRMRILFNLNRIDNKKNRFIIEVDKESIVSCSKTELNINSLYDLEEFIFSTKRCFEKSLTNIRIRPEKEGEIIGPAPNLLIQIEPPLGLLISIPLFVLLTVLFTTIDMTTLNALLDLFKIKINQQLYSESIIFMSKLFGAVFAAIVAFITVRKLPIK